MTLLQRVRVFRDGTRGSMPTEGVMAATFLIWWYIASFQFFDAYRQKNVNLKAAYTIADMVSRQENIDEAYVNGLNTVFDYLTYSQRPTWVRVSSVYWDGTTNQYRKHWSYATGAGHLPHTDASLDAEKARLPVMPNGDTVVLVETHMAYEPIFNIGLNARWYDSFIVTRPRVYSCVGWLTAGVPSGCGVGS